MIGVHLAEDLVNLAWTGPWAPAALCPLLRQSFVRAVDLEALDAGTMRQLHGWTQQLRAVFDSPSVPKRDNLPPHLHFAEVEDELVQRIKALTAGGLAIFAVEAEAERMGVCGRPGCGRVFVDISKNGRRAYCSAKCGNAHAVQRYRERQQKPATRA